MTPAEVKATREALGLSSQWLADRWGVALYSVQRWERSRALPEELAVDVEGLVSRMRDDIDRAAFGGGDRVLAVPRPDAESPDEMPPAHHRAVACAAARRTGARIVFSRTTTSAAAP